MRILTLVAAVLVLTACAPRLRTGPEHRVVHEDDLRQDNRRALEALVERAPEGTSAPAAASPEPSAAHELPVLPVTVLEPPATPAEDGEGRIARDELRTFIDQGPHFLFRAVELEPVLEGERFQGYRVASLAPEPEAIRTSGLHIGDVVTTVNGTDISNPDGFMRVWEQMRDADALVVEIVRNGGPRTLAWNIR